MSQYVFLPHVISPQGNAIPAYMFHLPTRAPKLCTSQNHSQKNMSNHENSFSNSYVPSVCAAPKNNQSSFVLDDEHSFVSQQHIKSHYSSSTSNASKPQAQWLSSLDGSTPDISESKK